MKEQYKRIAVTAENSADAISRLAEIIKILRKECPWDREQNHESLRTCLLEESYEVVDAINRNDPENLREELGDVLLQVVFHASLAEEEKLLEVRDDSREGVVRKAKTDKARTILELQNLVNDILADKVIEPQEVRQLKAWLLENQRTADEFAPMLKVIDDSLQDGIIDAEETQSLYEGVIDCLVALRSRTSN